MTAIILRPEAPGDAAAIRTLTATAFDGTPHSDGREPEIVDALRRAGALSLSLVAAGEEGIVGHIAFSPVTIDDGTEGWFGLGPVSVHPERQGEGIGFRLIARGIADLRKSGASGIVLLGDPAYYRQFGFEADDQLVLPDAPAGYFQRLVLDGAAPSGIVTYAAAFSRD